MKTKTEARRSGLRLIAAAVLALTLGTTASMTIAPPAAAITCGATSSFASYNLTLTASWTNCASTSTRIQPQFIVEGIGAQWQACKTVTPYGTQSWSKYKAGLVQWRNC